MRTSVLVAVLVLIPVNFAHAQIPTAERDALIALYNSTDGASWFDNTNWLGAVGTECTWFGVICAGGHVERLYLGSNQLSGVIPSELGNLSSLTRLFLYSNQLSGVIPSELGGLSSLTRLFLNSNQLSGVIPSELGSLSSLTHLYLYSNQLSGGIPPELGSLSSLTRLFLYSNQLSGGIPPELGSLSSLTDLRLCSNQLSGGLPPELGSLSSLTHLYLGFNQLSGNIPPELGSLSSLTDLRLYSNQLSGGIPPELGSLSSLEELYLDRNQLSGVIPPELGSLSSLTDLYLRSNQLGGVIPPELGNLSSLQSLALFDNQLSGFIPPELGSLSSLTYLWLHSNQLSGSIPAELEDLSALSDDNSDLRWNALHSDNATLIAFLNNKQDGGDWQSTQTIAPVNLTVDSLGDHTVWLKWDAVSYQTDPGGYSVFSAPTGSGVWTADGSAEAKTDTTYPVTGLDPGTSYDLAVVSYTDPHADNLNLVNSDFSPEVMAITANIGCAQPVIEIFWGDPITLSVPGSYDSYVWSTGETTSTIDIVPLFEQRYWVTVTSAGSCEETAAVSVDPTAPVFADGFESGNTTLWSRTVS